MRNTTWSTLGGGALLLGGWLFLATTLGACPEPVAVNCGGVLVCPEGTVCDLQGAAPQCLLPDQRGVCDGLADGAVCPHPEAIADVLYACIAGVCQSSCGDGVRQGDEVCDGFDVGGAVCDARFYQGRPGCQADCLAPDFSPCVGECGDDLLQEDFGEQCEPGQPIGQTCPFDDGTVVCTGCRLDFSGCGTCGNGVLDPGEGCDDNSGTPIFPAGEDCQSLGYYTGARQCQGCNPVPAADTCSQRCGDNTINGDEECDGGDLGGRTCQDYGAYEAGNLACDDCRWDSTPCQGLPRCGDGVKDVQEACDGDDLGDLTCSSFKFHDGELSCGSGCTVVPACEMFCGDGILNGPELCDGEDFGGDNGDGLCKSLGYYGGTPKCGQPEADPGPDPQPQDLAKCITFFGDVDGGCEGYCGDGIINGLELCDGTTDPPTLGCESLGYYSGQPGCLQTEVTGTPQEAVNCGTLTPGTCQHYCGDGVRNGNEACDGAEFGGLTCQSFGFYNGELTCSGNTQTDDPDPTNQCSQIDTSGCSLFCGDGVRNGDELCDGADFGGSSCLTYGATGGHLLCDRYCQPSIELCFYDGVRNDVSPIVNNLLDAVMVDPGTAYAVGINNKFLTYEAGVWSEMQTTGDPLVGSLRAIWAEGAGAATDSGWIVGNEGVFSFVGTVVEQHQPPVDTNWRAVTVFAGQTIIAGDEGHLLVYDGSDWVAHQRPDLGDIYEVVVTDSGAVYTAGVGGIATVDLSTGAFTYLAGGPADLARALLTLDDGQSWFVGGNNGYFGLWADNNGTLDEVEQFPVFTLNVAIQDLAVVGGGTVIAVGGLNLITYDGSANIVETPKGLNLNAVASHPDTDQALLVGNKGRVGSWNGEGWTEMSSDIEGSNAAATGIFGFGPDALYASNANGNGASSWDATQGLWDFVPESAGPSHRAVWGRNDTLWFVGDAGVVTRKSGSDWTLIDVGTTENLRGVGGLTNGADIWAVGANSTVRRFHGDGSNLEVVTIDTKTDLQLNDVWAASPDDVFIAGKLGVWWRLGGETNWSYQDTGPRVMALWGTSASNVFGVGNNGLMMRFDGTSWTTLPVFTNAELFDVEGRSPVDVFASGQSGTVLHYDGSTWAPMFVPTNNTLTGLWASPADGIFAVGDKAQFRRFDNSLPVLPAGECQSAIPIYCGSDVTGMLNGVDAFDHVTTYADSGDGCQGAFDPSLDFDAPDRFYRLDVPSGVSATITLQPDNHNLMLVVAEGTATGCGGMANCVVASNNGGPTTPETVVLAPGDAQTSASLYYIAVDGRASNNAAKPYGYSLSITCQKATP